MTSRNCYEAAVNRMLEFGPQKGMRLVHGYPRLTRADGDCPEGTRYGHAWLEFERSHGIYVLDAVTMNWIPRDIYYHVGRINGDDVKRYSYENALHKMKEFGTYGDWNEEPPVGTAYHECSTCGGIGVIGDESNRTERPCPECEGE